jgi:sarcosine oxidase subunit alpha
VTSARLSAGAGVDLTRPISFTFDGWRFSGVEGDTLASALIANRVRLVGRSFKYHRARGIMTAGPEEPNALVELRTQARREPNTRATEVELYDGLAAASQNRWPSLAFDLLGVNNLVSPLLSAGFYYKTFMWPASFWEKLYEPMIRRAAGLGRAAEAPDPDHYEKAFLHCDVLVIGSGPAGLAAALAAGRRGLRVELAEADFKLGGRLLSERCEVDGIGGAGWARRVEAELSALPTVTILRRTTVHGVYDGATFSAVERVADHMAQPPDHLPRQRLWRIFARRAVLAAGAIERPIAFAGNDRPGVMLAASARTYVNRFAAAPGQRLVVFTTNDDGWRSAIDAAGAGLSIEAVVDCRADVAPHLPAAIAGTGARIFLGAVVQRAIGGRGVQSAELRDWSGRIVEIECDGLLVAGGWSPTVHLTCHLGGKPQWDGARGAFVPGTLPPGMSVAGASAGDLTLAACLRSGARAGAEAGDALGAAGASMPAPACSDETAAGTTLWHVEGGRGKAFVDFQNDVTTSDLALAVREGYRSPELAKRYTTSGMATDQGKTSNVVALAIIARERGEQIGAAATTTYRPPYTPVSFGALAGHHRGKDFRATRLSPTHAWATDAGAVFMEAGAWLRPAYFPRGREADWLPATIREAKAVRASVGLCDVSTLGKIDIQGADAGTFLDRVYCNTFSTLPVGKARYGLMLREDGFVMDDGTTSRLGPEHFLLTTTTANAVKVMQHLEFCHQCLWPDLDVQMASVSEQWAQLCVAGPRARDVLTRIVDRQHDISNAAFPYLAARELTILAGTPARLFRISFSGELGYELAVPARLGDALARQIMAAGAEFDITPYGLEALSVLRIEKGHVAGGELNGQTTAADLGLGRMMSTKKDYIGRVMAGRPALVDADRWQLVGLKPNAALDRVRAGGHIFALHREAKTENDQGYVTSAAYSPTLERWIGLALVARGRERIGDRVRVVDPLRGTDIAVEICDPVFVDPKGERLHG